MGRRLRRGWRLVDPSVHPSIRLLLSEVDPRWVARVGTWLLLSVFSVLISGGRDIRRIEVPWEEALASVWLLCGLGTWVDELTERRVA
jgi:hypothetical protein